MSEKVCSACNELKPLEDFYKESRVKDGRMRRCKLAIVRQRLNTEHKIHRFIEKLV